MPLDPDDPNVRIATFGRQVEMFLETDIGKYLVGCASRESDEAVALLKSCDPMDPSAVVAAQMRAKVADNFVAWLGDAIAAGESAKIALEQEQAEQGGR
jgi:hypothetical protein